MFGQVLDAVFDQGHQRGQRVRRGPKTRLQNYYHALT
jgi:hypothetical protein